MTDTVRFEPYEVTRIIFPNGVREDGYMQYSKQPTLPFQAHSPTSKATAESIPNAHTMRERIYHEIAKNGPMTDEEIAWETGFNPSTARPRRVELLKADRIRQTGTCKTRSGRKAACWVVTKENK